MTDLLDLLIRRKFGYLQSGSVFFDLNHMLKKIDELTSITFSEKWYLGKILVLAMNTHTKTVSNENI